MARDAGKPGAKGEIAMTIKRCDHCSYWEEILDGSQAGWGRCVMGDGAEYEPVRKETLMWADHWNRWGEVKTKPEFYCAMFVQGHGVGDT